MKQNNEELLEVVDEIGKVLRLERRDIIHKNGLLHRDSVIWFWNDKGETLFEVRAMTKDTNPGRLGPVGGHPNPNESSLDCAVREIKEEMGIEIRKDEIVSIGKVIVANENMSVGHRPSHFREHFACRWNGKIEELHPDPEEASGYEWWSIDKMFVLTDKEKERFLPSIFHESSLAVLKKILEFRA